MRLGIDMMGGDFAPGSSIKGALQAEQELADNTEIVLIGDRDLLLRYSDNHQLDISTIQVIHTDSKIGMDDQPIKVYKEKPDASLFLGCKLLREGCIDGFCSAGNTGAMMVGALQIINSIPGVIRPAIAAPIPQISGDPMIMLDVGLNPDARPDVLYQYGFIGTIYSSLVHGIERPGVALLNVGMEEGKGNMVTRSTHQLMKETSLYRFIGNFEANELFVSNRAHVLVTDGFVGNMLLKQAEAFYSAVKARGMGNDYFEMFNFENFGGTPVLGVNAPLLIGHGISTEKAIKNMLLHTAEVVGANLVDRIKSEMEK
jgi:phosphate acyltransferase